MAGIPLSSGFGRTSAQPLDLWSIAATPSDLSAIPSGVRYIGMEVYVQSEGKKYFLKEGITDGDWVEFRGGGGLGSTNTVFVDDFEGKKLDDYETVNDTGILLNPPIPLQGEQSLQMYGMTGDDRSFKGRVPIPLFAQGKSCVLSFFVLGDLNLVLDITDETNEAIIVSKAIDPTLGLSRTQFDIPGGCEEISYTLTTNGTEDYYTMVDLVSVSVIDEGISSMTPSDDVDEWLRSPIRLIDATVGPESLTLPDPSLCRGVEFIIKKTDVSDNEIHIIGTIDGDAGGYYIYRQYDFLRVVSDGNEYFNIG